MKLIKYFIEAIFIYFLFFIFKIIGLKSSRNLSILIMKKIGFLFRNKKLIKKNISYAFKNYSDDQIEAIIHEMWINYGSIFAEYIYLDKFRHNTNHIKLSGTEITKKISKTGKPVIFVSGHLGNFELMAMELEKSNINLATIYRPLNNFFLNPLMVYLRKKYICKNQIKKGLLGMREAINFVKNNTSIALMVDQRVGESERCNFFGVPAHTTTIPAQLALKFNMEIIPIFLKREKDNTFFLEIKEPIKYIRTNNSEEDKKNITLAINKCIEEMIIKNPGQWIWTHSRWK